MEISIHLQRPAAHTRCVQFLCVEKNEVNDSLCDRYFERLKTFLKIRENDYLCDNANVFLDRC